VGDREIPETYSNSASKNTSQPDIFPHGPKSLLTSVIYNVHYKILHVHNTSRSSVYLLRNNEHLVSDWN